MGSCFNNSSTTIKVATLNYSGILLSPFQFYSSQNKQQLQKLNSIFTNLISQNPITNIPNFTWKVGSIDRKIQYQRYAPIYRKGTGVQNNKIISQSQFVSKWNQIFQSYIVSQKFEFTQDQKNQMRLFDKMCLQTFLIYVYSVENWAGALNKDPELYLNFCDKNFNKAFINQKSKLQKTIYAIKSMGLDIVFLQQSNQILVKQLQKLVQKGQYLLKDLPNKQSIILVKTQKLKNKVDISQQMLKKLSQQQIKQMNWNNDTALMFVDDFILISSHISSKSAKNQKQVAEVYRDLTLLVQKYPRHKIILGFDANNQAIDPQKITPSFKSDFYMIPNKNDDFTVVKKRTKLQPQLNKAETLSAKRSDYIITNIKMIQSFVGTINGRQVKKNQQLLPSNQHPFDHFMVLSTLRLE